MKRITPKSCNLCVYVIINKRSFEPFVFSRGKVVYRETVVSVSGDSSHWGCLYITKQTNTDPSITHHSPVCTVHQKTPANQLRRFLNIFIITYQTLTHTSNTHTLSHTHTQSHARTHTHTHQTHTHTITHTHTHVNKVYKLRRSLGMLATTQPKVLMTVGSSMPSVHTSRSSLSCRNQHMPAIQLLSSSPPTISSISPYLTTPAPGTKHQTAMAAA